MNNQYIWQSTDLYQLTWQDSVASTLLSEVSLLRGKLLGRLSMFGFKEQGDSMLDALTEEIVHSSEIEGERLNRDSVRSSVAQQLGLEYDGLPKADHYIEGVVQVMLDATQHFRELLTKERLFGWHTALFPAGHSGMYKITVGDWRKGKEAMQVVSGAMGRLKVHYEAPPSSEVPERMEQLLAWIADDTLTVDPLIKAAVAHLWFVTIHPFDDGNGRLCRTMTEMLLSRADNTPQRYYSLSSEILNTALEKTERIIRKVRFWDEHKELELNARQRKVLNMLLDGFEGKLNSSKWYKINHCSQDTATRDLNDLVKKDILQKSRAGGRSTTYELTMEL